MSNPILLSFAGLLLLVNTACSSKSIGATGASAPPEVRVVTVSQRDVPIYREWIGTLDGFVNADIKAQVSGYLSSRPTPRARSFQGPAAVSDRSPSLPGGAGPGARPARAGPGPVGAGARPVAQAEAQVAVAEANQRRTQLDVDRYTPLAQQQAITQQDLDNATQNNMAAKAQLQARAQVETAKAQIIAATAASKSARPPSRRRASISDSPASRRRSTASRESPSSRSERS